MSPRGGEPPGISYRDEWVVPLLWHRREPGACGCALGDLQEKQGQGRGQELAGRDKEPRGARSPMSSVCPLACLWGWDGQQ